MWHKAGVLVVCGALFGVFSAAAQDARSVLQAASAAMGDARNVRSIEYSGTGWIGAVGQSFTPAEDWPRFEVVGYTRTIDYQNRSSKEEYVRRQGNYPPQGGGGTPLQGEQPQKLYNNGNLSWNHNGAEPAPEPAAAEVRLLDIWLSPHGFLKAAMEAEDTQATSLMLQGQPVTIVSFTVLGKYRVNGTINKDNLVERTQTWIANPVLGDMQFDHRYSDYKDFGGVKFPSVLHSHQGDPRLNAGHNWKEVRVTAARPNVDPVRLVVPDNVRNAKVPPVQVESTQLANGVWRIAGGSHHSVAVEFRDFVAVVEAPLNEQRSLAVIAETRRLIPNKPIRYVVNTHHHFDHSGGLRTFVAQSATVVTHQGNREFYDDVVLHPGARTIEPDTLSSLMPWFAGNRVPAFETVNEKYVLSDGVRTMDIYPVQGLAHSGTMLVAYLPTEKILVNADLFSPPAPGAQTPAPNASMRTLSQNIRRLNLDVDRHVGIHGQVASHEDFLRILGET
jgi:glyoxylase-like metal-dependent hydrolase (beta-lactamase superfamily II)